MSLHFAVKIHLGSYFPSHSPYQLNLISTIINISVREAKQVVVARYTPPLYMVLTPILAHAPGSLLFHTQGFILCFLLEETYTCRFSLSTFTITFLIKVHHIFLSLPLTISSSKFWNCNHFLFHRWTKSMVSLGINSYNLSISQSIFCIRRWVKEGCVSV
jgi:hypothetical protein